MAVGEFRRRRLDAPPLRSARSARATACAPRSDGVFAASRRLRPTTPRSPHNRKRRLGGLNGAFFHGGWGDLGCVDLRSDLAVIAQWPPPQPLAPDWRLLEKGAWRGTGYRLYEGSFPTPCVERVFNALPPESRRARARLLLPERHRAGVVHLAATGDQGWRRRLWLGWPMMEQGVATVVLESPFYGAR